MADLVVSELIVNVAIIAISLVVLNWAGNTVVKNAVKVAKITRLGKASVGFALISMSTTLPELTVAFSAAMAGGAPLSVGNALGSNVFNICVVIGLGTLVLYPKFRKSSKKNNSSNGQNIIPSFAKSELGSIEFGLFISSTIPLVLIYISEASWIVGLILLFIFVGYMYKLTKVRIPSDESEAPEEDKKNIRRYIALTIGGALGVVASANFMVNSAINIAQTFGISQQVIGATIIAAGTSLPELTIGIKSILKGHAAIAFGNIIGASFFNMTLILGITFFVPWLFGSPISMNLGVFQNLVIFSILTNLFFWYFLSRERIGWREGIIFLFLYCLFLITTIGTT